MYRMTPSWTYLLSVATCNGCEDGATRRAEMQAIGSARLFVFSGPSHGRATFRG